jgi:hypothetical protein
MDDYYRLEDICELLADYLQDETSYKGDLWSAMYLIEDARDNCIEQGEA